MWGMLTGLTWPLHYTTVQHLDRCCYRCQWCLLTNGDTRIYSHFNTPGGFHPHTSTRIYIITFAHKLWWFRVITSHVYVYSTWWWLFTVTYLWWLLRICDVSLLWTVIALRLLSLQCCPSTHVHWPKAFCAHTHTRTLSHTHTHTHTHMRSAQIFSWAASCLYNYECASCAFFSINIPQNPIEYK